MAKLYINDSMTTFIPMEDPAVFEVIAHVTETPPEDDPEFGLIYQDLISVQVRWNKDSGVEDLKQKIADRYRHTLEVQAAELALKSQLSGVIE